MSNKQGNALFKVSLLDRLERSEEVIEQIRILTNKDEFEEGKEIWSESLLEILSLNYKRLIDQGWNTIDLL